MHVPVPITVAVLLVATIVIASVMWVLRRATLADTRGASWRLPVTAAAALTAWLVAVSLLAYGGAFAAADSGPPAVAYPLVLGVAGILIAARSSRRLRDLIAQPFTQRGLIALHSWRVGGSVFLALAAFGYLHPLFALPAGLGDFAIAIVAPFVARGLASAGGRRMAVRWAVIGLLDLIVAVTLGATSSPGTLQVFHTTPSAVLLSEFPLALFPTFLVPIAVATHLLSLRHLLRGPVTVNPLAVAASPSRG